MSRKVIIEKADGINGGFSVSFLENNRQNYAADFPASHELPARLVALSAVVDTLIAWMVEPDASPLHFCESQGLACREDDLNRLTLYTKDEFYEVKFCPICGFQKKEPTLS